MTQVSVKRTKHLVPTPDDPERALYQVEYRAGELPPRFLFIAVKEWTKEKEAELIKADIAKRMAVVEETLEV